MEQPQQLHPLFQLTFGPMATSATYVPSPTGEVGEDWVEYGRETGGSWVPIVEDVWHLHGWDDEDWSDEGPRPYGYRNGQNVAQDDLQGAQAWAAHLIAERTDFRVTGWHGTVPILVEHRHELVFELTSGKSETVTVGESRAQEILSAFDSPRTLRVQLPDEYGGRIPTTRDTVTVRLPSNGDDIQLLRINLHQVTTIRQTIRAVPVKRLI